MCTGRLHWVESVLTEFCLRLRKLIDMGEGDRHAKKTHFDNLWKMVRYCENVHECRRALQLEYFGEVLRIERLHRGGRSPVVARLLNKMGNIYLQKADVPKMMECFAEATRIFEGLGSASSSSNAGSVADGDEEMSEELKITGYNFYSLSMFHPKCAAAA